MLDEALSVKLERHLAASLWRQRELGVDDVLSFCDNDYLGLARHPRVKKACMAATDAVGVGAKASQFLRGFHGAHQALEAQLAEYTGLPRALLFSCGYMANLSVISTLCHRGDHVFLDRLSHASMIDGVKLSGAKLHRYAHNDVGDLAGRLNDCDRSSRDSTVLISTESVFSMEGDKAPLQDLSALAVEHNARFLLDDAHGLGVVDHGNFTPDIYMATFGKALGVYGAFVACSDVTIEALIQFAKPLMYTTALPPALASAASCALRVMSEETWRRDYLCDLIVHFKKIANNLDLHVLPSDTPIQIMVIGEAGKTQAIGLKLQEKNFLVSTIRPPTVPQGGARLRFSLSVNHSFKDIDRLLKTLKQLCSQEVFHVCA